MHLLCELVLPTYHLYHQTVASTTQYFLTLGKFWFDNVAECGYCSVNKHRTEWCLPCRRVHAIRSQSTIEQQALLQQYKTANLQSSIYLWCEMGAYKYLEELWRKKQSDGEFVMHIPAAYSGICAWCEE